MSFTPQKMRSGTVLQAGISYNQGSDGMRGSAMLLRGVVLATWVYDDPNHPYSKYNPAAIYCDVLIYSVIPGGRVYLMPQCLVLQPNAGCAKGAVVKPRAAKGMTDGGPLDLSRPLSLDGDNVLVGFIDNQRTQPVVMGFIPHPTADQGTTGLTTGHRTRLVLADGDPSLLKHHGCVYGVTDSGNIILDATLGNQGMLAGGVEVPGTPGKGGSVALLADQASKISLLLKTGGNTGSTVMSAVLTSASLTVGGGGDAVAVASKVDAALATIVAAINGLTQTVVSGVTVVGATTPPTAQIPAPATTASSKLLIPST